MGSKNRINWLLLTTGIVAAACLLTPALTYADEVEYSYNIAPNSLAESLNQLARQSGQPLLFPYNEVRSLRSDGINGHHTFRSALDILLAGSGLKAHETETGVMTIVVSTPPDSKEQKDIMENTSIKSKIMGGASAVIIAATAPIQAAAQTPVEPSSQQPVSDRPIYAGAYNDEVIVTARKRSESLQKVPLSITAFPQVAIQEANISTVEDVAALTPGLSFDQGIMPSDTRPSLRGVSGDRGRPGVAMLVDGIDVSSENLVAPGGGVLGNMRLLDLERIEVVKGPQSVLYGRSAFVGAINYVTRRPADEFGGRVQIRLDENNSVDLRGMIEGPLAEGVLNAKASVFKYNTDGWAENPNTQGSLGAVDSIGASLSAEFKPNEAFTAYGRIEYTDDEYSSLPKGFISSRFTNQFLPVPAADGSVTPCTSVYGNLYDSFRPFSPVELPAQENCIPTVLGEIDIDNVALDLSPDPRTGGDFKGSEIDTFRASLEMEYDLGSVRLVSLTGYTDSESHMDEDFDQTNYTLPAMGSLASDPILGPFAPFAPPEFSLSANSATDNTIDQFSQEVRLYWDNDKMNFLLDGLYWHENMEAITRSQFWARQGSDVAGLNTFLSGAFGFPVDLLTSPLPADQFGGYPVARETDHWSIAGSLTYNVTDDLRIGVEGRYLDESLHYTGQTTGIPGGDSLALSTFQFPSALLFDTENKISSDAFLPRFSVDWQARDDVMLYAQLAKGFKPAGVSTVDTNGDVTDQEFFAETLWAYEAGVKTSGLFDGKLRLNLAAYFNDYKDRQVGYRYRDSSGIVNVGIVNAAKTKIYGFEADALMRITDRVSIGGGYAYTDGEYKDFNLRAASERVAVAAGEDPSSVSVSPNNTAHSGNPNGDFSGNSVTFTSKHSLNFFGRHDQPIGNDLTWFTALEARYNSKRFVNNGNDTWLPSHWLADARIGLKSDNWQAFVFVDNLFDNDKPTSGTTNADYGFLPDGQTPQDAILVNIPQPRTIGVQFGYDF